MSYYQAHLLLLAGYSQFFVSGLVLPQPAFDDEEDYDMTPEEEEEMESFMDEDESPEDATIVVDEPCPRFASNDDEDDYDIEDAEPVTPVTPAGPVLPTEQRRRKRLSVVSESHVRTMSRWLLDSAISLGDRQRQVSSPESLSSPREEHETKRFCSSRKPRLPALQTSFTFTPPRLSVA